jgi:hypothetical protein
VSPRYNRPLPEKIMAVVGTYLALVSELDEQERAINLDDPIVQAELLRSSVTLALASDTRDIGLLSPAKEAPGDLDEGVGDQDTDRHGDGDDR